MMNKALTHFFLLSASALFLANQTAVAMDAGDAASAAASTSRNRHLEPIPYPDASQVTPERAAANPRINGRPWTCTEEQEFQETLKDPNTKQAEVLLKWMEPFTGNLGPSDLFFSLHQTRKEIFPDDTKAYERHQKKQELDHQLHKSVEEATSSERKILASAQASARKEAEPFARQFQHTQQGIARWDYTDHLDSEIRGAHFTRTLEEIYSRHTQEPQKALDLARSKARSEYEAKQEYDRLLLEMEELVASAPSTFKNMIEELDSNVRALYKPLQEVARHRNYSSGEEYRERLKKFLIHKQQAETNAS